MLSEVQFGTFHTITKLQNSIACIHARYVSVMLSDTVTIICSFHSCCLLHSGCSIVNIVSVVVVVVAAVVVVIVLAVVLAVVAVSILAVCYCCC